MIRTASRLCLMAALAAFVAFAASCGTPTAPTTVTTTTTTTTTATTTTGLTTDTFNGQLSSGGVNYHVFHTLPGGLTVTLVSLDPSTLYPPIGVGFGMWDGTTCTLVLSNSSTAPGQVQIGTAALETDVCIKVWDPTPFDSSLVVGYQITASHYATKTS
jgi:hypothetical protein